MEFSRQEYWRGLPFPSPGDLPNPGIKPESPTLQVDALLSEPVPSGTSHKELAYQFRRQERHRFSSWVGKIPWGRAWQPIPVLLPGESHGQRIPAGDGP